MSWKKLGLIFSPKQGPSWMYSHCQLPVADNLFGYVFRVYFASRSKEQISQIGFIDVDIRKPNKILNISEKPILQSGKIGCFDEYGVFPSSIVNFNNKKYLYYIGWVRGYESPMFYATIGLAISDDNGESFRKYSSVPIMERSVYDPCLVTSPHVFLDGKLWRMTYVSGIKWEKIDGVLKSFYHIKYAESKDGITWQRNGKIAVDFKSEEERNIARSAVIKKDNNYHMWFSYVEGNLSYRIGYAFSRDGIDWTRDDNKAGIQPSENSFDSEMICYPNIISHDNNLYMFYNGNQFGKEGFGLAIKNK